LIIYFIINKAGLQIRAVVEEKTPPKWAGSYRRAQDIAGESVLEVTTQIKPHFVLYYRQPFVLVFSR
jgi:hypothetical protein